MKAYSEDLRRKIVAALERGGSKTQTARLFGVSLSSVKSYARTVRQGVSLAPKKRPGRPPKVGEKAERLLQADIEERPAATISDRRRLLERIAGTSVSDSTVGRLLKRMGFSRKLVTGRVSQRSSPSKATPSTSSRIQPATGRVL